MALAGPSNSERFYRITGAAIALAPVPWLGAIAVVIREICDIVERIKMVQPHCRGLADEVTRIANALQEHHNAHPGNSKLEEAKDVLSLVCLNIKIDLTHWENFNKFLRYYKHRDVLARIEFHRSELDRATKHLMFKGTLDQDVEGAKREREMQLVQAQVAKIELHIEKEAQNTVEVKEAWRASQMVDIDAIEENEARIFSLRLDPANFPSADMQGEVVKVTHEAEIMGTTFDVFRAKWLDKKWVAAKRFRGREWGLTPKQERRFTRQMNIWRSLKHPNIVPVFGICRFEEEKPPYLISPWMKYGNVRHYLKKFPQKADRVKLIHEVALGLQYIHSLGILHGNLNGTNVLISINHCVRLTGFSLSRELQEDTRLTNSNDNSESFRWWAPETMKQRVLSEQSDIWSWGMTALEILSGDIWHAIEDNLPEPEDYDEKIASERVWTLMQDCWKAWGSRADLEHIVWVLRQERMKNGWNPDAPPPEPKVDKDFPEAF
ncbi:hypothetical protein FRC04_000533 [Tulasnella sp. 424]|nr:hypothetical protein FRC04_000533 [Tulasnella sp. 424]KAG8966812.1 hypothetical protein FRC05_002375 [Tulasnella sp. 425]